MFDKEITFDRFIRGLIIAIVLVAAVLLLKYLSPVLLPFFIAWIVAYMLYPLVRFLQYRCHLYSRVLSIVVALLLVLASLAGILYLVVPPTIAECAKFGTLAVDLAKEYLGDTAITDTIQHFVTDNLKENDIVELIKQDNVQSALQMALSQAWNLIYQTMGFLLGLFGLFIIFLYMFFILMDYENISSGWVKLVPEGSRAFCQQLVSDVQSGMNAYFRGQSLIAFIVGVLFAIGFSIVGLPMAVGLGLFIGLLNLVPYLQLLGFLPTIVLALMKSTETGQSFWVIFLWCLVVFAVVQTIQDMVLTPKIMGRQMGLNPAIILLSLSVWGALLGFIGLIIALPLTTLCLSYYKRYILKSTNDKQEETSL